jgi:hypothetical protein
MSECRGPAGAASLPRKGPDALARVLDDPLSEGIQCNAHTMRLYSEATSNGAFQSG